MSSSSSSRGYAIALAATFLWSSTGVIISYLNRAYALPSLVLAFWRDLFLVIALALFFVLFQPARLKLPREAFGFMALFALILALFNSTWTFSVEFNGASVATVLGFSSPAFTAILSRWLFKERITPVKWISIALSLLGIALVSNAFDADAWQVNPFGILFGAFTGFIFACYNLMGKSASNRGLDSWTTLLYAFGGATVLLFAFNIIYNATASQPLLGNFLWPGDPSMWGILLFLGIGPTLGGFGLYTLSLSYLPATVASLIATLEPILTAIWAFLFFGELLNPTQLLGGVLVFAGVILLRLRD